MRIHSSPSRAATQEGRRAAGLCLQAFSTAGWKPHRCIQSLAQLCTAEISTQTMKGMLGFSDGFKCAWGAVTLLLVPASLTKHMQRQQLTPESPGLLHTRSWQTQNPHSPSRQGPAPGTPSGMIPGKEVKQQSLWHVFQSQIYCLI